MANIRVITDKCVRCSVCMRGCPVQAIKMVDRYAFVAAREGVGSTFFFTIPVA